MYLSIQDLDFYNLESDVSSQLLQGSSARVSTDVSVSYDTGYSKNLVVYKDTKRFSWKIDAGVAGAAAGAVAGAIAVDGTVIASTSANVST